MAVDAGKVHPQGRQGLRLPRPLLDHPLVEREGDAAHGHHPRLDHERVVKPGRTPILHFDAPHHE
jgi:hypothetical protein